LKIICLLKSTVTVHSKIFRMSVMLGVCHWTSQIVS
jgi:hypothetical protein